MTNLCQCILQSGKRAGEKCGINAKGNKTCGRHRKFCLEKSPVKKQSKSLVRVESPKKVRSPKKRRLEDQSPTHTQMLKIVRNIIIGNTEDYVTWRVIKDNLFEHFNEEDIEKNKLFIKRKISKWIEQKKKVYEDEDCQKCSVKVQVVGTHAHRKK